MASVRVLCSFSLFVLLATSVASKNHHSFNHDSDRNGDQDLTSQEALESNWLEWIPQWVSCEFDWQSFDNGPKCYDCNSVVKCTPVGGILRNCGGPKPYCNNGICTATAAGDCLGTDTDTDTDTNTDIGTDTDQY